VPPIHSRLAQVGILIRLGDTPELVRVSLAKNPHLKSLRRVVSVIAR